MLEVFARAVRGDKAVMNRKERSQSILADYMILYIKYPKDSSRKLSQIINTFTKLSGCKNNTEETIFFLYTNDKHIEREREEAKILNS